MALPKLRDHFQQTNREEFIEMLNQKLHVVERLAGSSFAVKRDLESNKYYKSGQQQPMDLIDRTVVKFYENAVRHFQGLSPDTKSEMPRDWKFCFDYIVNEDTPNVKYAMLPKNNLVLSHIRVLNPTNEKTQKIIRDTQVLNKWADKLEVQRPPVVFEGMLDSGQKEALIKLLEMNDRAFEQAYESRSYTKDLFHIFNNGLRKSALQESLDADIDALIVSFVDGKNIKSFKLEDPRKVYETENRKPSDMFQITVLDLIEFMTDYDFSQHKLVQETKDRRFLELMCEVFNNYIDKNASKYVGVDFQKAEFAKGSEFDLNTMFIDNQKTLKLVDNEIMAELFKIQLSAFRNKREKETALLSKDMLEQMNQIIEKINSSVDAKLAEGEVLDFQSFKKWDRIQQDTEIQVNEALKVKTTDRGLQPVNIFVGRFQPFTLGHAKVLESLHKQNGFPVIVFLVKSKTAKKEDAMKRPYDEATQMQMFKMVQREYNFLKDIRVIPFAAIDTIFNEIRPEYEPVLWGTGTDRLAAYAGQAMKDSYREQLNVLPEFGMHEIKRGDDDISATKVRQSMLDDNMSEFKRMVPKSLHPMYAELKDKLERSMEMAETKVNESVMTFEEFMNKLS